MRLIDRYYFWERKSFLGKFCYRIRRYFNGARKVHTADYDDLDGSVSVPGWELFIEFGGGCPVQGEGILEGHEIYYRSRGEGWQFHVYTPDGEWVYERYPYYWPDGGWVSAVVSAQCILEAVKQWRKENDKEVA